MGPPAAGEEGLSFVPRESSLGHPLRAFSPAFVHHGCRDTLLVTG
jgi:hypothetical protein